MFSFLYAITFLLLLFKITVLKDKKGLAFLAVFIIAGAALALYENADFSIILSMTVIFNGIASTYHSKENYALFLIALFALLPLYSAATTASQGMLLGWLSGAYFFTKPNTHRNLKMERRRDVVQILVGIFIIYLFASFPETLSKFLVMIGILFASTIGNYAISERKTVISRIIHTFERKNAVLGQGALWLAMGSLVAISFLSKNQIIVVMAAIFVGDSVATLVGTHFRWPLPYNRKKSIAGALTYFVSTAIISFPFLGTIGIFASLVAAFVESFAKILDDNFDTAVVLTLFLRFV